MTLWYLARAAGFVAVLAASLTVALGAAGTAGRADRRVVAQLVHRSAAVVTLAMLGLHAALLVTDHHVDVSVGGALVPFTAGYRGTALGLGTLAVYGFVAVALTGAARGRMAAGVGTARAWRAIHLSAYAAWVLAMAHGLLAGSDTGTAWAPVLYGACALLVALGFGVRVVAATHARSAPLPSARRQAGRRLVTTAGGDR